MNTERHPEDSIDQLLAALKAAVPPAGLETRITHRLAQTPASAHRAPSRSRYPLFSTSGASTFWRGAATGAAFALLTVAAVLLLRHQTASRTDTATTHTSAPTAVSVKVAGSPTAPCAQPAVFHHRTPAAPQPRADSLLAESQTASDAPSHPAPALPLTAQERELVRMARIGDPKQLATINPETQAQLLAQQAADFDKFFAPPPTPPATPTEQ
jgi:hypothetical protein